MVLAEAGARLMTEPELLTRVRLDFRLMLKSEGIIEPPEQTKGGNI